MIFSLVFVQKQNCLVNMEVELVLPLWHYSWI